RSSDLAPIVTDCSRCRGPRLVYQKQCRSPHRGHIWLPRELFDETRGAVHAADSWNATHFSGHAADLYRRGAGWSVESARLRFRAAAASGAGEISAQSTG